MIAGDASGLRLVVMGPSGCGKTTLARALARQLQLDYVEGDDLHPPSNRAKMRSGQPLDDVDRAPWLEAVAAALAAGQGRGIVVACSALKRRYRDRLRSGAASVVFVLPQVPRESLARRLAARVGHFMPANLLDSQLADLEPLQPDEDGIQIDGAAGIPSQVKSIQAHLSQRGCPVLTPVQD